MSTVEQPPMIQMVRDAGGLPQGSRHAYRSVVVHDDGSVQYVINATTVVDGRDCVPWTRDAPPYRGLPGRT